jgi:hypothetical protein
VPVQAVVRDVQLAVREPLEEGFLRVVEGLGRLFGPVDQLLRLPHPESLRILSGLFVDRFVLDQGVLVELLRRGELLDLEQGLEPLLEILAPQLSCHLSS